MGLPEKREKAIDICSDWMIKHHTTDYTISRLQEKKEIYTKYNELKSIIDQEILPTQLTTRKGNFGEIVLIEYLSAASEIDINVYKLHFNRNINQPMSGDDVLLFNADKIFVGESKYRKTPTKKAIVDASEHMRNEVLLPVSLPFVKSIYIGKRDYDNVELIDTIQDKLIFEPDNLNIINVAFILSEPTIKETVENHANILNNKMIFLTLGVEDVENFFTDTFKTAEIKLLDN